MKVLVLDSSAFVMGINPSAFDLPTYSVMCVLDELIPNSLPHTRFGTSRDSGHLTVKKPTSLSMKTVEETSSRVCDVGVLSRADIEVLALALESTPTSPTLDEVSSTVFMESEVGFFTVR